MRVLKLTKTQMPQESPCKLNSRCWIVLELEAKSCQCSITVLEISQLGLEVLALQHYQMSPQFQF